MKPDNEAWINFEAHREHSISTIPSDSFGSLKVKFIHTWEAMPPLTIPPIIIGK